MKIYLILALVVVFFAINFIVFDDELMFYFFVGSVVISLAAVLCDAVDYVESKLQPKHKRK